MAIISKVEDLVSGAVLHSFLPAIMPVGEQGWQHRNSTFTISNINFGSRPLGDMAAAFAPRKYPWQVRVEGRMGYDAAKDALALAIGQGYAVRVVQTTDQGYERVCKGWPDIVGMPFDVQSMWYYDFKVEWEFNSFWTERNPVNTQARCGQVPPLRSGQTGPSLRSGSSFAVAINAATFNVPPSMVDASAIGPGGQPNQPDTGSIITVTGTYGGSAGFNIANLSDRYGCYIYYPQPLLAGQQLVIDTGAWKAILTTGGVNATDVTNLITVVPSQPYLFAVTPGVANVIQLTCVGTSPTYGGAASFAVQWSRYFA